MIRTKIEVKIWNIKVSGKTQGYYSFNWEVSMQRKKTKSGIYDNSWSSQTNSCMRNKLKRGFAVQLAVFHFLN